MKNKAFTLIELLVVILIIGILAAIALPQYQLAKDKSKFMSLVLIGENIASAQERYYLLHNNFSLYLEDLDIELPGFRETLKRSTSTYYKNTDDSILLELLRDGVSVNLTDYCINEMTCVHYSRRYYSQGCKRFGYSVKQFPKWDKVFLKLGMQFYSAPASWSIYKWC